MGFPRTPQEEEALLGFLADALDDLHRRSVDKQQRIATLCTSRVNNHLLILVNDQRRVVGVTPGLSLLHLLSVS